MIRGLVAEHNEIGANVMVGVRFAGEAQARKVHEQALQWLLVLSTITRQQRLVANLRRNFAHSTTRELLRSTFGVGLVAHRDSLTGARMAKAARHYEARWGKLQRAAVAAFRFVVQGSQRQLEKEQAVATFNAQLHRCICGYCGLGVSACMGPHYGCGQATCITGHGAPCRVVARDEGHNASAKVG